MAVDFLRTRWCFIGLAFLFAWNTLSNSAAGVNQLWGGVHVSDVLYLTRCACLLVIGLCSQRFLILVYQPRAIKLMGALGIVAIFVIAVVASLSEGRPSLAAGLVVLVCALATGVAQSFVMMAWFARFARLPFVPLTFFFVASNVVSTAIPGVLLSFSIPMANYLVLILLPILTCALLLRADSEDDENSPASISSGHSWSFPIKPALLIGIFAFTTGYARCFFDASGSMRIDLLGASLTALATLVLVIRVEAKFNLKWLHWVGMPLVVSSVILVGHHLSEVVLIGGYCATVGFMFIQFFVCISLCTISFRYGINPLWLLAPVQAARFFGSFLGALVGGAEVASLAPMGEFSVSELLIIVICVAYATFLTSRETERSWGVEPVKGTDDGGSRSQLASYEVLKDECARMARRFGLTLREEEVLFLLAEGRTQAQIEKELFISKATVKSHCSHVYSKLGVSGKAELVELLNPVKSPTDL